ncbi:MAG: DTW domain-containing protein [Sandaracinaceae bacterium]|nr:DTW domain-containing protein [Sandaracinaceae bacterium]
MIEPRPTCPRCQRPLRLCWCAHVTPIETRTRVVFLQHPREASVAIGTARMAHLCLPRSELYSGVHWQGTRALERIFADPERPPAMLYPGEGAIDVMTAPPAHPITLVVIDGTWAQARKIVNQNPSLQSLPRYAFRPPRPSNYRIRREPDERFVSTIEALSYVLGALEGDPQRFRSLLQPFEAMVDAQVEFAQTVHTPRRLAGPRRAWKGAALPPLLTERRDDLVCVVAEGNAWPYGHPLRTEAARGELVHLVATRLATGERFEAIARPRMALAPNTARHIELDEASLLGAPSLDEAAQRFRSFLRDGDVLVTWGSFTQELLQHATIDTAQPQLDLRTVCRVLASQSVGALEDLELAPASEREASAPIAPAPIAPAPIAPAPIAPALRGRAGDRLVRLTTLTSRVLAEGARLFAPLREAPGASEPARMPSRSEQEP